MQHAYKLDEIMDKKPASKGALVLQKASVRDPGICKGNENSLVFMEASMLPIVSAFLFGGALIRCFEVCPLWFVVYYKTLDQIFSKIDMGFKTFYGHSLHLEYARTDWSPVHVADAGIRIDRILIARVTNLHVNRCTKVSYGYAYQSGSKLSNSNESGDSNEQR